MVVNFAGHCLDSLAAFEVAESHVRAAFRESQSGGEACEACSDDGNVGFEHDPAHGSPEEQIQIDLNK